MGTPILLVKGVLSATIHDGQLRSLKNGKLEFMHHPDEPGWRKSDDEMFPVVGATQKYNYRIETPKGEAILDQHGLLRELDWQIIEQSQERLLLRKSYTAGTRLGNSKYPGRSPEASVSWPYDFSVEKEIELVDEKKLQITFTVEAESGMPFQFGYHPAFKIEPKRSGVHVICHDEEHSLEEIMKAGAAAFPLMNSPKLRLQDGAGRKLQLQTQGFGHFMCWTEVTNMLCVEPVTHYPAETDLSLFEKHALRIPEKGVSELSLSLQLL